MHTRTNKQCSGSVSSVGQTWWQLLGDLVGCGGGPLWALNAVDELHHGLGHLDKLFIVAMTLALFFLFQQ